jgi:hypothetical protein
MRKQVHHGLDAYITTLALRVQREARDTIDKVLMMEPRGRKIKILGQLRIRYAVYAEGMDTMTPSVTSQLNGLMSLMQPNQSMLRLKRD